MKKNKNKMKSIEIEFYENNVLKFILLILNILYSCQIIKTDFNQ